MQITTTSTTGDRVPGALRGILPYHVYSAAELRVEQHRQGNGLPQVVTGYDPDPLQTTLIQSVAQQLVQTVTITITITHTNTESRGRRRFTALISVNLCCYTVLLRPCKTHTPKKRFLVLNGL